MSKEEYREYIVKMLDEIESESALKRIFGFVHKFSYRKCNEFCNTITRVRCDVAQNHKYRVHPLERVNSEKL